MGSRNRRSEPTCLMVNLLQMCSLTHRTTRIHSNPLCVCVSLCVSVSVCVYTVSVYLCVSQWMCISVSVCLCVCACVRVCVSTCSLAPFYPDVSFFGGDIIVEEVYYAVFGINTVY